MRGARAVPRGWDRFWFREVDALPFAVARVGIALAGLVLWAGTLPLLRYFYSDAGEFPIGAARAWSSELVPRLLMPDALGGVAAVWGLFLVWGLALVALLVGWRTAAAAWANWLLVVWFLFRNPTFLNGGDEVLRLASFYLALGYSALPPARRLLTLDRRRADGAEPGPAPVGMPAWPLRLLQVQIAVVYFVSGFWKVLGPPWWDGSALHLALDNAAFTRFGAPDAPWLRLPYAAVTLAVAWWELLFPALMSLRRTRLPALLFGVTLHLGILLTMSIGIFPFVMLGCYPAFLRGEELRRTGRWLGGWGRGAQPRARSSSSAAAAAGVSQ